MASRIGPNESRGVRAMFGQATSSATAFASIACVAALGTGCKTAASSEARTDAGVHAKTCEGLPKLERPDYVVGFVQVYEPGNPWTAANTADMLMNAEKSGHKVVYEAPTAAGGNEQNDRMEALINAKVDVIVLRPVDATSLIPAVMEARAACIPVLTVNRVLDPAKATPGKDYVT